MPVVILDLPFPVSLNAIWRSGNRRVYKSARYQAWIAEAGALWMMQKPKLKIKHIKGRYKLTIAICEPDQRERDLPNLEKVCSDFCQSMGIIEKDSYIRELHMVYCSQLNAPYGARLKIESVP